MSSFQYTRKFIDDKAKLLSQPFGIHQFEQFVSEDLPSKKLQQILDKVNVKLRQHNRLQFNSQIVEQVTQQIVKNEHKKLMIVNESLVRLSYVLIPIQMPSMGAREKFSELVKELPEPRYIFSLDQEEDVEENGKSDSDSDSDESNVLIQDGNEAVEGIDDDKKYEPKRQKRAARKLKKDVFANIRREVQTDKILALYKQLRDELIHLDSKMNYKSEKLAYLKNLKQNISATFANPGQTSEEVHQKDNLLDSDEEEIDIDSTISGIQNNLIAAGSNELYNELNKFRVLIEKLTYKMKQ